MNTAISHQLTLDRVILHFSQPANQAQQTHWRWRVTDALSRIALYPAMPPQAILIVRHLPDPLPGGLLSDRPWQNTHLWEQKAQAQIDDCWRTAIHAAYNVVPPSANAVCFADVAEWLACLSWDIHQGIAAQRWWWQTWLRKYPLSDKSETLFRLWQAEVQWLPQTLNLLHQWHSSELQPLLASLSPDQAHTLRQWVTQAYSLPDAHSAQQIVHSVGTALPVSANTLTQGLPEENQAFVILCLAIIQTPATLHQLIRAENQRQKAEGRSASPQPSRRKQNNETLAVLSEEDHQASVDALALSDTDAVAPIDRTIASEIPGDKPQHEESISQGDAVVLPSQAEPYPHARIVSVKHTSTDSEALLNSSEIRPPSSPTLGGTELQSPSELRNLEGNQEIRSEKIDSAIQQPHSNDAVSDSVPRPTPTPQTAAVANNLSDSLTLTAEQGISTALGGIWYLVNVLADLNWLVDNTKLNGWHKLLSLSQALLLEVPPDLVWQILSELTEEEASEEELSAWLEWSLPAVQHYLSERLEEPNALRDLMSNILQEPATLYVTRTHVDVVFSLDQIRLDVRIAGLDRDPGWVPALARVIAFHYE